MKKYYRILAILPLLFFSCGEDEKTIVEFSATISVSASPMAVSEGDDKATFTISISEENISGSVISIPFTLSGSATGSEDYSTPNFVAQIDENATSTTVTIDITDDEVIEENETIVLILGTLPDGLSSTSNEATITIQDNDSDSFSAIASISTSVESLSEADGSVTFSITLDKVNSSGNTIVIPLTLSGTAEPNADFTSSKPEVEIPTGETSAAFEVSITDDTNVESDETIILTLGSLPDGLIAGTNTATVTVQDNDQTSTPITFGDVSGNTIAINSWTNTGADRYLVVVNSENSFSTFSDASNQFPGTTYIGYGEQVVYNSSVIGAFEVSLLSANTTYYFKVIPKSGSTYDNDQSSASSATDDCVTTSTTDSQVCFDISTDLRTISSNQLANHAVGNFPNGNPTAIQVTRALDISPSYTGTAIYVYDETGPPTPSNDNFWKFGIASNGVEFHPMGLKPWENPDTGEENWEWQAKVTEEGETDLDAYGAHVTSAGNYHYHGDITGLADEEDGAKHSVIYGFAADGFPIYYKYGYADANDQTSTVKELLSSYRLKSGSRTGTGTAGEDYPDGSYDGTYIQDFEFVSGLGDLDECNGRTGVTPEFPGGTYYYVITSNFPVTPNCFFGTPAEDWKIGK